MKTKVILVMIALFIAGSALTFLVMKQQADHKGKDIAITPNEAIEVVSESDNAITYKQEVGKEDISVGDKEELTQENPLEDIENSQHPPYPLKPEKEYPLIQEIKNHELFNKAKDTYKGKDDDWIQNIVENEENHLIGLAYKDLENTPDVELKDYDWQGTLFKDYLEKHYKTLIEESYK